MDMKVLMIIICFCWSSPDTKQLFYEGTVALSLLAFTQVFEQIEEPLPILLTIFLSEWELDKGEDLDWREEEKGNQCCI